MVESEGSWMDDKEITSSSTGASPGVTSGPQWSDNVFPPTHNNRTLVVCFDGTGDQFDADVSYISLKQHLVDD